MITKTQDTIFTMMKWTKEKSPEGTKHSPESHLDLEGDFSKA